MLAGDLGDTGESGPSGPQYTGPKPSLLLASRLLFWPQATKKLKEIRSRRRDQTYGLPLLPSQHLGFS
jgi:hypothetical protein